MQASQPIHNPPQLLFSPSSLHQTTIENAKRIHQLESLIRAERQELDRLLVQNATQSNKHKRSRHSPSLTTSSPAPTPTSTPPNSAPHSFSSHLKLSTTPVPTTPPAISQSSPHSSPKGIMDTYQISNPPRKIPERKHPVREMAARGSHWSFVEKARFEAALHKYGPFAWDQIIRTVGTRSEKQVKAYAARYRRRKKLAAKAQLEAVERLSSHNPTPQQAPLQTGQLLPFPPSLRTASPSMPYQSGSSDQSALPKPPADIDNLMSTDQDTSNDTTLCDLFGGNPLFDTAQEDQSGEVSNTSEDSIPADVEFLVDRALGGEFVVGDESDLGKEVEPSPIVDEYPSGFLNAVFSY